MWLQEIKGFFYFSGAVLKSNICIHVSCDVNFNRRTLLPEI